MRPGDCVHTLFTVHSDEGANGLVSVFTNDALVRASLAMLEPLYRGETALKPERRAMRIHRAVTNAKGKRDGFRLVVVVNRLNELRN